MDTKNTISRIPVELPASLKHEFMRLARERHDRGAGPMIRVMIREWVANEQAAEAEEAAA